MSLALRAGLIVGIWSVCGSFGAGENPAPERPGQRPVSRRVQQDDAPADAMFLRLHFVPGGETVYRVVTEKKITNLPDKKTAFETSAAYTFRCKTLTVHDGPVGVVRYTIDRLEYRASGLPGGKSKGMRLAFDSQEPVRRSDPPEFAAIRQTIGKSFDVSMDTQGQPLQLRAVGENENPEETKDAATIAAQLVNEQQLLALLRAQHAWIPSDSITLQEPWSRTEEINLGTVALVRRNTVWVSKATSERLTMGSRIDISGKPTEGLVTEDAKLIGEIVAKEPGRGIVVFNSRSGLLESLAAQVQFEMRTDTIPFGNGEPTTSTQLLDARTQVQLLEVDGQAAPLAN